MLALAVTRPSPEPSYPPTLADLSRNASVISSSSSSESTTSLLKTPRPRPLRTFSSPRSRSPHSPARHTSRPPAYLSKELGISDKPEPIPAIPHPPPKSRNNSANGRYSSSDFHFGDTLGEGSYSTVMRATHIRTGQEYAIKILDKGHLRRNNKMLVALAEKNTLVKLGISHPGIVHLHSTFQDDWSLYFVLDLATNGEMQSRIAQLGSLSTTCARYYAAQIVDAVEYMHSKDVIHRDLKPENLLLDNDFRIKITDFGTGKILEQGLERAKSFVGTAQYVSPELLEANETSKSSDLWATGCIIYQMLAGRFAFQGLSEYLTWQKIKQLDYTFPDGFDEDAKDLVQKLLIKEPLQRLGAGPPGSANDRQALRSHPFFAPINWQTLWIDPAPPLESGLVKKELPIAGSADQHWDDVGATWDTLVCGTVQGSDEISWAPDAKGPEFERYQQMSSAQSGISGYNQAEDIGPLGEVRTYVRSGEGRKKDSLEDDTATISAAVVKASKAAGLTVPFKASDSANASGSSSSSEGSPIEKLGAAFEAITMRGRNRARTPVQGNIPLSATDWSSLLQPGESVLFESPVEARSPKRRGSRLLIPIAVATPKLKSRRLVLTNQRLICVKQYTGSRGISIKSEFGLRPSEKGREKEREKESRSIVASAEVKAEREFAILTSSQTHAYAAESPSLALNWVQKINDILISYGQPVKPRPSKSVERRT